MTTAEWFAYADTHKDVITRLINNFHPVNRQQGRRKDTATQKEDFITAPNAEAACVGIRKEIRDNYEGLNPTDTFLAAVVVKDFKTINKILNETWFGVPESTACWDYDGFREAVTLLEDLPEDMTEEAVH